MITPDTAWGIVLEHVQPLTPVLLPFRDALGSCLAESVRADRDLPPADRSAMDGYAIRHSDLEPRPCTLRIIGEVEAGSPQRPRVRPGACARIFTGGNVPPGADTVVMLEQTEERNGSVLIRTSVVAGANILRRGEDARKGTVLLPHGTRMSAQEIGVCASVGKAVLKVHRRPRVTILCTGSELRPVDGRVRAHEIRNSNGPALCAALEQWGVRGVRFHVVADRQAVLLAALRRALTHYDVVLFTGGVSAGSYDFVRAAVEAAGAAVRFHGVSMKPGKPTLYATSAANRHIFGLPGNPLSASTALHEFALPALRRLGGYPPDACRPGWFLPLTVAAELKAGRTHCNLARLLCRDGKLAVAPVPSHSSADLVSAGLADGVIVLPPAQGHFAAGDPVLFRPWRPLPWI